MHTERMPCEHEGRDQDDMSTSQETTKIASKPPEAAGRRGRRGGRGGKVWNSFSQSPQKKPTLLTP